MANHNQPWPALTTTEKPAHLVDDTNESHEEDPMHQVDLKDEHIHMIHCKMGPLVVPSYKKQPSNKGAPSHKGAPLGGKNTAGGGPALHPRTFCCFCSVGNYGQNVASNGKPWPALANHGQP